MNQATIDFIRVHADDDVRRLALKGSAGDVDMRYALEQIAGRQMARRKLPSWAAVDGLVYPPHLSMEQCSGERAARYKGEVVARLLTDIESTDEIGRNCSLEGNTVPRLVDLTGGFGVDFASMAHVFDEAVYVERQKLLCDMARHNMPLLGLGHAEIVCADSVDYLKTMPPATMIFLDPARRDDAGSRTFAISDCTPDVMQLRDELLRKAQYVIVKLSPMLDWRKAMGDLGDRVGEVHIVAVDNECKDLLIVMSGRYSGVERIYCVNNDSVVVVSPKQHDTLSRDASTTSPRAGLFLYEPNAAIMKAGCFSAIEERFGVCQIERNSHLFLSAHLVEDFPGRRFVIEQRLTMNKKELKKSLARLSSANVSVRNFPLTANELRRRLNLTDGGDTYLFGTTESDGSHVLLVCSKT